MIHVLLVLAAFVLSGAVQVPVGFDQQATVLRLSAKGNPMCSAVVISPGVLRSAAHCFALGAADAVEQGGKLIPITGIRHGWPENDSATILAPGVECPCAPMGEAPGIGETVVAVGYPYGGNQATTAGTVLAGRTIAEQSPLCPPDEMLCTMPFLIHTATLIPGMSGGGTFAYRDGKWLLVATNSAGATALGLFASTLVMP